jgi:hypothetical protein
VIISRHIGFTGTQAGMSEHQKETLRRILTAAVLSSGDPVMFHHGDCTGADAEAHEIALSVECGIIIHPPMRRIKRAYCQGANEIHPPKEYILRNHDIVDASIGLIAAPKSNQEELRSGTWATIRYARKMNKRVILLAREST